MLGPMRRILAIALLVAACGGRSSLAPAVVASTRAPAASDRWWNGAVVYEVFVRSYRDSDGDGKGDLRGLIQKLDYLNDGNPASTTSLGVDAIWLMPIHPSPSYHGYDVTDYDGVNPDYGTQSDMDALIAECHRRGIKVILDFVPNHTSSQHPWFRDAVASPPGSHRDWYVWSPTFLDWTQPWNAATPAWYPARGGYYYALFWSGMPDLNWRNAAVRAELGAAAARWLTRSPEGVDGFRLDAIRYLVENGAGLQQDQPETHAALKELAATVRAARADAAVIGEAWADAATIAGYYGSMSVVPGGDEVPLPLDFPVADALVSGVASGSGGAATVAAALDQVARTYPPGAGDAPFLTNHDQQRVATRLLGDGARLRLAAAILLTLQGTPVVYYGEEIGMANGTCPSDECKRTPMAWETGPAGGFTTGTPWWPLSPGTATANVAAQAADPASLLSRYRSLIRLRRSSPALSRGGTQRLSSEASGVLSYLRVAAGETVLVAHNLGTSGAERELAVAGGVADVLFADPGATLRQTAGGWTVSLPASGSGVWRLR